MQLTVLLPFNSFPGLHPLSTKFSYLQHCALGIENTHLQDRHLIPEVEDAKWRKIEPRPHLLQFRHKHSKCHGFQTNIEECVNRQNRVAKTLCLGKNHTCRAPPGNLQEALQHDQIKVRRRAGTQHVEHTYQYDDNC